MSYIGNIPTTVAFLVDTFSGNGSTTAFTLSQAPANTSSILVAVSGVVQDPSTYSVSGVTLTFSGAPPSGTSNISVRFLGIPASGVATTAYRTVTEFTATAGQTTFSVPSYTAGYIDVYRNGVMLGTADFTATTGTTVVLAAGATAGDLIRTESFFVSSVLNAIPAVAGAVTIPYINASGTASSSTYLRGDGSWATVSSYTNADALTLFNATGSAPVYACRAWVNFNGDGTVAIRGSGNVSSITDNDVGDYTVNFTTAMPDTNYSVAGTGRQGDSATAGTMRVVCICAVGSLASAMTTSSVRVSTQNANASAADIQVVCVNIFR